MAQDLVIQNSNQMPAVQQQMGELSVEQVLAQVEKIQVLMSKAMKVDEHYGTIPGTKKPTLLKAGAEKLCLMFRLDPEYEVQSERDGNHLTVTSRCVLYHISSGVRMGSGMGSCSTRESKYAYRKGARLCPACNKATLIHTKRDTVNWWCNSYNEGCGQNFKADDARITGQQVGQVDNPDIADTYNTILKMANKRSLVAAVLNVTAASDIFTQDLEDLQNKREEEEEVHVERQEEGAGSPEPAKRTRQTKPKTETAAESTGTQAATGAEPEATLLQQIETAFAAIEYPDDAKREEGRRIFLGMFGIKPREGFPWEKLTWGDLWNPAAHKPPWTAEKFATSQVEALIKIMNGKAESQRKAKEAQG